LKGKKIEDVPTFVGLANTKDERRRYSRLYDYRRSKGEGANSGGRKKKRMPAVLLLCKGGEEKGAV